MIVYRLCKDIVYSFEKADSRKGCPYGMIYNSIRAKHLLLFIFSLFSLLCPKGHISLLLRKRWTIEFESLPFICYTQRKGIKEKSLIPFLARKERLDRASPVLFASQTSPFFVPFASQKMDY